MLGTGYCRPHPAEEELELNCLRIPLSGVVCSSLIWVVLAAGAVAQEPAPFTIPNSSVHTLHSEVLGRSYDIFVKMPVGYGDPENADLTYPVIYLNDGPYTFQVASGATHLPMGASHRFERAILVGISYAHGEGGMDSRVRDLTPIVDEEWTRYETGGAPDYIAFIETEVFPYVEHRYRADPAKRTLAGQSLGGSFGAWVLLTHTELFSSYVLTSPSLWFKDRYIFDLEAQYANDHDDLRARVYFAVGELETVANGMQNDMVTQLQEFEDVLRSRDYPGLELQVEVIPGALHETTFPQGFIRGVHWIYGRD